MAKQTKTEEPLAPVKKKSPPAVRYTPNITPLIDVLFLLLLFFVLAGRVRQDEGFLPGSLPGPNNATSDKPIPPPLIVEVRGGDVHGGEDRYNTQAYYAVSGQADSTDSPVKLRDTLKKQFDLVDASARNDAAVYIKFINARWGFVVNAYNQAAAAGYKQISVQQLDR